MLRNLCRFLLALLIYYLGESFFCRIFVYPGDLFSFAAFLPPLLGLMWGPAAAGGVLLGGYLAGVSSAQGFMALFVGAYLPYKLWYLLLLDRDKPVYSFSRTILRKFLLVMLLTYLATSVIKGLFLTPEDIAGLFTGLKFPASSPLQYAALTFLNDFFLGLFFDLPLFFILISFHFEFFIPRIFDLKISRQYYEMNRLTLVLLFTFFLGLLSLLDVSGIIYDLDTPRTWLHFVGEIVTIMDITLLVLLYLLTTYRHSIMTNIMLMELTTMVLAAMLLGSVSFLGLSRAIDQQVYNYLEKMSVIYRERLAQTFNGAQAAVNTMGELATSKFTDHAALQSDAAYRTKCLSELTDQYQILAGNSPGAVTAYLQFTANLGGDGLLCGRNPASWARKLPPFQRRPYIKHHYLPQELYLAKFIGPYYDDAVGRWLIAYVSPLRREGRFLGVVGIEIDVAYLQQEIERVAVYERGFVSLTDQAGNVLYEKISGQKTAENPWGLYRLETDVGSGLHLRLSAYAHDIYADRNTMLIHFLVMVFLIVIAVSFFSVWLGKKGIRPLMLITEAAKKIAAGDLNVRLPQESRNELGVLVQSLKDMVEKLESYVYRDKLTGLRNTAAYQKKAAELEEKAAISPQDTRFGVIVFDANFLKRINDTYGHEAGNELIRRSSKIICDVFAHSPVFRVGGDEFVAILEHHDYEHREELLVEFDRRVADEAFEAAGEVIHISVARGLGLYRPGTDYAAVFKEADEAMYANKAAIKAKLGIVGR